MFESYLPILLIAVVLGAITQGFVNSSYRRYSKVALATGQSGAEVARRMLDAEGLANVTIERVPGRLTDHYDPRANVLRLSEDVYGGRSVAAAGVAAHEAGHAVQHARGFAAARLRQALVPTAQIGSSLAFPLIFAGLFVNFTGLITLGVVMFAAAVLFQIVTLPVEFDASRRALAALNTGGMLPVEQVRGARTVLTAAALTYVAATLIAVMQLLYYLGLSRR
ncbi:MAG: zinc metallopeptidase [Coriobacteriia bacterium]|jgi:Zn-dependent membrane protease YugP|nr:zinc metallopeptidase [Coriobacteriia bacterium]